MLTSNFQWQLVIGLCIRLIGVGIIIHPRSAQGSDAELFMTQVIQGIGGSISAVASQVGAQASVPHADVATVTAVVFLITEIGGAVGNGICTHLNFHLYLWEATDAPFASQLGPSGHRTCLQD